MNGVSLRGMRALSKLFPFFRLFVRQLLFFHKGFHYDSNLLDTLHNGGGGGQGLPYVARSRGILGFQNIKNRNWAQTA